MAEVSTIWRSVTPTSFTDDDVAVWRDGKPWCAIHPYKCLVSTTIPALRGRCDGGTHICPVCMRGQLDEELSRESGIDSDG